MSAYSNRSRKYLPLMGVLVATALLGAPTQARADFAVRVIDDAHVYNDTNHGGTITVMVSGNATDGYSLLFSGTTDHFSLTNGSASSNNPGDPGGSSLSIGTNETINTTFGVSGGKHTIKIEVSQTDWTSPAISPVTLNSSGGGSMTYIAGKTPGAVDKTTITYQGFLDNTNTLFGLPSNGPTGGSTAIQSASGTLTSATAQPQNLALGTSVNFVAGGTPFSLTDVTSFTFDLGAGNGKDGANFSGSTVASAPAPAGLMLALTGLPVLGVGAWFRRRRPV